MLTPSYKGLYAIVDSEIHENFGLKRLMQNIVTESKIPIMQLRLKRLSTLNKQELIQYAHSLQTHRPLTLIINDDIDFLDKHQNIGLHLGQNDIPIEIAQRSFPHHIMGLSTHSLEQAQAAERKGVSYIGCGAVFTTNSKKNTNPLGLAKLTEICAQISIPKVAIGGINQNNIKSVAQTGCEMAAVISALIHNNQFQGQTLHAEFLKWQKN